MVEVPNPKVYPPEAYAFAQFKGMRNTVTQERLAPDELEVAQNVDLDDAGQIHRRRGQTRKFAGRCHSLFPSAQGTWIVKDGELGTIDAAYDFTAVGFAADNDPLAWAEVGPTVYFSSRAVSGQIVDRQVAPWGEIGGERTWLSPVVNPSPTLAPIRGRLLGAVPLATSLAYLNGRIYLAQGRTLWATELYQYHLVDKTRNFLFFEDDIVFLAAVTDGLYVGTESTVWFLKGTFGQQVRTAAVDGGGIAGSVVSAPPTLIKSGSSSQAAVMFMTRDGVIAGFDGGQAINLTQDKVLLPDAQLGAAMFRRQDGMNHFIGVLDSAGTPTAAARIGDYVEAEVRRFQGG